MNGNPDNRAIRRNRKRSSGVAKTETMWEEIKRLWQIGRSFLVYFPEDVFKECCCEYVLFTDDVMSVMR